MTEVWTGNDKIVSGIGKMGMQLKGSQSNGLKLYRKKAKQDEQPAVSDQARRRERIKLDCHLHVACNAFSCPLLASCSQQVPCLATLSS